jgi:hypothetical protein
MKRNLRTLAEFLRKQNTKGLPQDATNTRYQSVILMALQLGLIDSMILGSDEKSARIAWDQSIKVIIKA